MHTKTLRSAPVLLLYLTAFGPGLAAGAQVEPAPAPAVDYGDKANWLCRPGGADACAVELATTIVHPNGALEREEWSADPSPAIDCFYVYATVSTDSTTNSDMSPDEAELRVVAQQFARFGAVCRTFAPSYRQVTLAGLRTRLAGGGAASLDQGTGYDDVRDAFHHYLEHDNQGRGFVLIGHSQGSFVLTRLIREEIEGEAIEDRLVSAILLGATVTVTSGRDTGGSFAHLPLCRSRGQTGCVITYVSFRSTAPPPQNTLFGRATEPGQEAACTNPAALGGGSAPLHAYLATDGTTIVSRRPAPPWVDGGPSIETPFVSPPGLLSAACASNEHATYLEITVRGDPEGPRVDDVGGDLTPQWGLHLIDVNLAMGNILEIVRSQAEAWEGR